MAKNLRDIENPMLAPVVPLNSLPVRFCTCGCRDQINIYHDEYIVIDGDFFSTDRCVSNFFIKEAGGHRYDGGAIIS
ncbi:hypothetical protein [Paenibacillus sp. XY044]|uniref:hypothetical protein n=1 Tax=Paenibacillus sp. XY044 TaxID=2026089 RepID=UPI000B9933B5|nr:hypothetical protein [Paenibacillus sp. XY044]OZB90092.1 hypothetical protein CJP46_35535 [Paenibacillus sp. XY044]